MDLSYRNILITELARRKKVNAAYSLRAFARDLGLAAPQLSSVMKGIKGISLKSAQRIAAILELSETEADAFQHSAIALHSRELKQRKKSQEALAKLIEKRKFQTLNEPNFSLVNEWFYLSLLQLFELKDFQPSALWMATKLDLSKQEVEQALKQLALISLLKKTDDFYKPNQEFIKTDDVPSRTIRFHLQQMMKKASQALENQTITERDFSSTVFSIDASQIGEFKKKIQQFREHFCEEASQGKKKTEVYNLSIQFFRITNKKTNKENL